MYSQHQFLQNSMSAKGTVTRLERRESKSIRKGTTYIFFPEVEFKTQTGGLVRFVSQFGSGSAAYQEGDTVEIVYNPRDPESAEINSFGALWFGPVVCFVVGAVFGGISVGMGFRSARLAAR